ncbi:peptidoglycan-binding protein [Rhizobium sp. TRM95111]|uniref:peptidoglycan-binding protein n=1 Tax=Rhizobium alarense TaxID=2846851 RepID=UPI001F417882|nr:peptidoglycan-binding protein [Rhizobium alarense]MCF3642219.1 peptidoglycan-binding protein [Rhizobium alarense]
MNGSRAIPPRQGERSSLDALNRTIEGLEARIEGLMSGGRDTARGRGMEERFARPETGRYETPRQAPLREDPVTEIMQRQRALEAGRERTPSRFERRSASQDHDAASRQAQQAYQPAVAQPDTAMPNSAMKDIAQALVNLRLELKRDMSEGLEREMNALRAEMRGIRQVAESRGHGEDMRDDLQRLAASIQQLGRQSATPEAESLRVEFDELRSVLDGLAREDSVRRMEDRWNGVERKLEAFDVGRDDELVALAYRLDELKAQISTVSATPAIRDLESKLQMMAQAVETLGRSVQQPDDRRLVSQFEGLDARLDEISRAIAASGRVQAGAADLAVVQRLENRIADLASQVDTIAHRPLPEQGVATRIEALAARVEEIANEEAVLRLEERLDQLSRFLAEVHQSPAAGPDLTGYLSDISRKIDALDQGAVSDVLAERLDYLARRIDELDVPAASPFPTHGLASIEDRLLAIADRLDRTGTAPAEDNEALRGLEAQIAHLSTLISQPQAAALMEPSALPVDLDRRMASIEEYMATNDEYVIEAARQAAEAVMEAYQRNGMGQPGSSPDMAAISALADDLRVLEDLTRSSEERTARTFDALHETLVQIAGRLEELDQPREAPVSRRRETAPAMPRADAPSFDVTEDPFEDDDFGGGTAEPVREAPMSFATAPVVEPMEVQDEPEIAAAADLAAEAAKATSAEKDRPAKKSLIAGLARRFAPGRKDETAPSVRQQVDPAPSLDPGDELAPEVANELLEPGSGGPDVRKILERVRASQQTSNFSGAPVEGDKTDFIAAARRAARMAAEESDTLSKVAPQKRSVAKGKDAKGSTGGSALGRHRRPILLAVGAVLLAIMSYPLVNTMVRGDKAPAPAAVEQTAADPAESTLTGESVPATANVAEVPATAQDDAADSKVLDATPDAVTAEKPADVAADDAVPLADGDTNRIAAEAPDSGQSQMTSPADDAGAATGGFEPLPATGADAALATEEEALPTADGTQSLEPVAGEAKPPETAATIAVPEAITPPSLAKAASEGDSLALFEVGARYTDGRGVTTDMGEALKWYQLSADRGFAPAQYRLANLYEKGQGVERDLARARELYRLAADQGNASAMHNLAVLLATGGGGSAADFKEAATWFQKAADLGVRDSQFNLAILYARGNGVPQDLEESYKWFAVAAREGDRDAAAKRDEVANAMRPEQLTSAKAKFDLWKPLPLDDKANTVDLPDEWAGKGTKTATVDMARAIRNIQAILNNNGFNAGTPDGQMGRKTVAAIKAFQKSVGQAETGKIDDALVTELLKRNK